jgi:hypothetical protein
MRKFTLRGVNPFAFSFSEGPIVLPGTCPQASSSKEPIAYSFRCVPRRDRPSPLVRSPTLITARFIGNALS